MAKNVDARAMSQTDVLEQLNSTPLGTVAKRSTVSRHKLAAGLRIGPRGKINPFRYVAWLLHEYKSMGGAEELSYQDKHRLREAERRRKNTQSIRDIGEIPAVQDPERKESCRYDLAKFIMTYAPEGKDPFSEDHVRVIKRTEKVLLGGGRLLIPVYRGFGKSTISEIAVVWAICYGHRRYMPIIAANQTRADDNLESIKGLLESDAMLADFPEVCYPIQRLEGIAQRAHGQLYQGKPTHIEWSGDFLVMPMIPGSEAAGSVILSCGIESSKVRGAKKRRGDGVILRPDGYIIDDPQDEKSAAKDTQINKRMKIIKKAIIRSAGHTTGLAVLMPCTIIEKGDLIDQLLDPIKNPAWQGEVTPFVKKWSKHHDDLWLGEYASLRNTYDPSDIDDRNRAIEAATEFYKKNRKKMDEGAEVSWEYCFAEDEGEISAIQHAYNALIDDGEEAFACEFQNQPLEDEAEDEQIKVEELSERLNNYKKGVVPDGCETLTAFIDVQGKCLYWLVAAWGEGFTGYVVDYGIFPEQGRKNITLREVKKSLKNKYKGAGQEGAWYCGFQDLVKNLCGQPYTRDDGVDLYVSRCLIDANDGNASETIYRYCRESDYPAVVMPSRGRGVTAAGKPFAEYKKKRGDKTGLNWRIPLPENRNSLRVITADVNYWKSFIRSRLRTPRGDKGALTFYGSKPEQHSQLFAHCCAEYSVRTEGRGRVVDEWSLRPNRPDNHWFDCLVGCAVAASEQGAALSGEGAQKRHNVRRKISHAEWKRRKKGGV